MDINKVSLPASKEEMDALFNQDEVVEGLININPATYKSSQKNPVIQAVCY